MQQLKDAVKEVIDRLSATREEVIEILNFREGTPLKKRITDSLTQQINSLSVRIGQDVKKDHATKFGRVTKMLGKTISEESKPEADQPDTSEILKKQADEIAAEELNDRINEVYPVFNTLANDEILDSHDEYVIRGIAIRAGLPVTENFPEKVDSSFIDSVKEAIQKKQMFQTLHETVAQQADESSSAAHTGSTETITAPVNQTTTEEPVIEENSAKEDIVDETELVEETELLEEVEESKPEADQPDTSVQSVENKTTATQPAPTGNKSGRQSSNKNKTA